jgi:predicted RND superfamily exporter protein
MSSRPPTDTRAIQRQFNRRMVWLVVLVLVVIGALLIAAIYGPAAGLLGLACLVVGASVIGLLWLVFSTLEKLAS